MEDQYLLIRPRQKAHLHVANGMLPIYKTLVSMRYLQPSWIQQGPHDIGHLILLYQSLDLDPSIIYLYILPYLDTAGVEDVHFLVGGDFADSASPPIELARDPMFSSEAEEIPRPWMTPLSHNSNHICAVIYDAKKHPARHIRPDGY